MRRLPFRYLEPAFFSGLLDDPVLYLHVRPSGSALLFDCGQIQHLAKRVLRSVTALFVSHAHMDHFMGFDTFIRNNHVAPRTVDVYGPPGIAGKAASKLAGYDWNLCEPSWCTVRVHELHPGVTESHILRGGEGFVRRLSGTEPRQDRIIHRDPHVTVEAEMCDHKIPSLMFRVTERPGFYLDEEKLEATGLVRGDWLRILKRRFYEGLSDGPALTVLRRRGEGIEPEQVVDVRNLYESIRSEDRPAAIGYVTDIGFSEENVAKLLSLMEGVSLLVCECSFLAVDRDKARVSCHLCTSDLNYIMDRLRPTYVLPMHLSKSYTDRSNLLYQELEPPAGVTVLRRAEHVAPRPLMACEVPPLV